MKIVYVTNIRFPTEKAHGIQIMEMCSAFKKIGQDVKLVVSTRATKIDKDPFDYYDIDTRFPILRLPALSFDFSNALFFLLQAITFSISACFFSLFQRNVIFYTRDRLPAYILKITGRKVVWEEHLGHTSRIIKKLISLKVPMVVITQALKDLYEKNGVDSKDILLAPDGVDVDRFDIELNRNDARNKLNLPKDKKIVLYKGHLYTWKGAGTLAQAAEKMVDRKDIIFVFIGGTDNDVAEFKKNYGHLKNVYILGNRPRKETPVYQKAADILVIPNSAKDDVSKLYTSPMKMFGYMAGDRPIITSNLPSLREVLNEKTTYFFEPDNADDLSKVIELVFSNYSEAQDKAKVALEAVRGYSWKTRAQNIIGFINRFYH